MDRREENVSYSTDARLSVSLVRAASVLGNRTAVGASS
jgi:hypothetical protein